MASSGVESGQFARMTDRGPGHAPEGHTHRFQGDSLNAPPAEKRVFRKLEINLPSTAPAPDGFTQTSLGSEPSGYPGQSIELVSFAPEGPKPLTPLFTYRNGRTGGGGTSRKALHEASRKLRRNQK